MDIKSAIGLLGIKKEKCSNISLISKKHGNMVYNLKYENKNYVLKSYSNDNNREVKFYDLLKTLNIPTLKLTASCESAILLESIDYSLDKRIAKEKDLEDENIIIPLAHWYRDFHDKGKEYIKHNGVESFFLDETSYITKESLEVLTHMYKLIDAPGWKLVVNRFQDILSYCKKIDQTFNYNDFSHLNMVISNDSVFMYDFHLMGYGMAYSDIRNVLTVLDDSSKKIFLEHYGNYNEDEKILDDPISILVALCISLNFEKRPSWTRGLIQSVFSGEFLFKFKNALNIAIK